IAAIIQRPLEHLVGWVSHKLRDARLCRFPLQALPVGLSRCQANELHAPSDALEQLILCREQPRGNPNDFAFEALNRLVLLPLYLRGEIGCLASPKGPCEQTGTLSGTLKQSERALT